MYVFPKVIIKLHISNISRNTNKAKRVPFLPKVKSKMLQFVLTLCSLLLFFLKLVHGILGNQCNIYDLRSKQCDDFEICDGNTNTCQCLPGYFKSDTTCQRDESSSDGKLVPNSSSLKNVDESGGSIFTSFFIPFMILIALVGGIYLSKKYNFVHWIRNKFNLFRRANYDEFMIGQDVDDDPPLR